MPLSNADRKWISDRIDEIFASVLPAGHSECVQTCKHLYGACVSGCSTDSCRRACREGLHDCISNCYDPTISAEILNSIMSQLDGFDTELADKT
jgi:hypothetical protein